jgi:hypothetical protein
MNNPFGVRLGCSCAIAIRTRIDRRFSKNLFVSSEDAASSKAGFQFVGVEAGMKVG